MNGVWGTLAVGLFATPTAPAFARGFGDGVTFGANQIMGVGLFYGGGFTLLGIQIIGVAAILAFTAVTITLSFLAIRATVGLRVSEQEEIVGLDVEEHGWYRPMRALCLSSAAMCRWVRRLDFPAPSRRLRMKRCLWPITPPAPMTRSR